MTEDAADRFELMAPAGSYPALAAAIRAGADSLYFGIDRLKMRSRAAKSFTIEDLGRIVRICHWCRVRCYLTLNTIVYDSEQEEVGNICAAAAAGIDAVIAMDFAAIAAARRHGLSVHISVQANIAAVRHYAESVHARQVPPQRQGFSARTRRWIELQDIYIQKNIALQYGIAVNSTA